MARLSLSLLGPFQVTLNGQPVTGFESDKVRALLAYLAVEAERPHRREALVGLLWPERIVTPLFSLCNHRPKKTYCECSCIIAVAKPIPN